MDTSRQQAHFLRRATSGATWTELESTSNAQDQLQAWLQDPQPSVMDPPQLQPPRRPAELRQASPQERMQARRQRQAQTLEVGSWLLQQRISASNPLHETITNIWRDHLVVSFRKVPIPHLLLDYDLRLRQGALGDYQELLWNVTTSPAMLLYLDNQRNKADNLNENYSRELMELFTIGRGQYTEADVQEGARALTGWTIVPPRLRQTEQIETRFVPRRHDGGEKSFLGYSGNLKAEDVVEILANHPSTARTVSQELWSRLAYADPEPEVIDRLAGIYQGQDRNIAAVVEAIFASPEFYSERAYRSQVKSPQDFLIGSIRQLQIQAEPQQVLKHLRTMGQLPYGAPSVKGWPEGSGWLNSVSLLNRLNLAQQLIDDYGDETGFVYAPADLTLADLTHLLLDGDLPETLDTQLSELNIREATALILASPTYQLA